MGTAKILGFCLALSLAAGSARAEQPYAIVVAGIGGEPEYEKQFRELGERIGAALKKAGVPQERVAWLPPDRSRREEVALAFDTAAGRVQSDDPVFVFLIGHGSYDGAEYKLNLPGPDATASDLKQWLDRLPTKKQIVINATSSSGACVTPWSRSGRAVIASTKGGEERNATVFMRFFADALSDPATDTDKNGAVSALEAFRYASQRVAKFYEAAGRIPTEHSQLDDNGDGTGARDPSPQTGDGLLASSVPLVRFSAASTKAETPAMRELRARRQSLENDIDALKYRKASMSQQEYSAQLEKVLVELARTQQRLENAERGTRNAEQ